MGDWSCSKKQRVQRPASVLQSELVMFEKAARAAPGISASIGDARHYIATGYEWLGLPAPELCRRQPRVPFERV
jgi:hypothetical protein